MERFDKDMLWQFKNANNTQVASKMIVYMVNLRKHIATVYIAL